MCYDSSRCANRLAVPACLVQISASVNLCRRPSRSSLVVTSAAAAATATAPAAADPMAPARFGSEAAGILGSENGVPDLEPEVEVKCNN